MFLYLETCERVVPVGPEQGGVLLPEGRDVDLVLLGPLVHHVVAERAGELNLEVRIPDFVTIP